MCVVGKKKKERQRGIHGWWTGGEIKKKKEMGRGEWGLHVWWEKRRSAKERRNGLFLFLFLFFLYFFFKDSLSPLVRFMIK